MEDFKRIWYTTENNPDNKNDIRNATCQILHKGYLTEKVKIEKGVKQGCILSPLLFNICLDYILKKAIDEKNGIGWNYLKNKKLADLEYADDICLIASSVKDMKTMLEKLVEESAKTGLYINVKKTKEMRIGLDTPQKLYINEQEIENVEEFSYLGSILNKKGGTEADIQQRIRKAKQTFSLLTEVWRSSQISKNTKIRILNSNVKSVLLYGCETWAVSEKEYKRLQAFINTCLRKILKIYWPNTITNTQLWTRTKQNQLRVDIRKRKWGWIGHTLRKEDGDITKDAIKWTALGQRRRGRPTNTWKRITDEELKKEGKTWKEASKLAKDKKKWKSFVDALCSEME